MTIAEAQAALKRAQDDAREWELIHKPKIEKTNAALLELAARLLVTEGQVSDLTEARKEIAREVAALQAQTDQQVMVLREMSRDVEALSADASAIDYPIVEAFPPREPEPMS